ncbi:MAG: histidine phosphatase family protein [Anaerolineae bacterium]|nr:histidine phosphatase family protein [Anaerolineae bacterium]
MKTLLILRHAKSSWKDGSLADYERPLNKRGERDAPEAGYWLRKKDLTPELILCSPARRARQTAELAAEACGYEGEIVARQALYASGAGAYLDALHELDDAYQQVMVVGHNPDLEELLAMLTGSLEALPTAALAEVVLPIARWAALDEGVDGELRHLWTPRAG